MPELRVYCLFKQSNYKIFYLPTANAFISDRFLKVRDRNMKPWQWTFSPKTHLKMHVAVVLSAQVVRL
jgi:hypothetical protein